MRPRLYNSVVDRRSPLTAALLCLSVLLAAGARVPPASGAQGAAAAPKEMGQVRPGESRRQEIEGGEAHVYRVTLSQGQYLRAVVEQDGIDLAVSFFEPGADPAAPDAKPLIHMDSPNGSHGPESVSVLASASGEYLLDVRSEAYAAGW